MTTTKTQDQSVISAITTARLALDNARQEAIEKVKASGVDFLFDRAAGTYVGPDRHNAEWTVTWDPAAAAKAAGQMFTLGERECNWRQCECKRSQPIQRFNTQRNF